MATPASSMLSIRSSVRATSRPKRLCSITISRSKGTFFALTASSSAVRPGRSKFAARDGLVDVDVGLSDGPIILRGEHAGVLDLPLDRLAPAVEPVAVG